MFQPREPFQPAPSHQGAPPPLLTPSQAIDIIRRQWPLILSITGIGTALVLAYVLTASPRFTASARILMDTRQAQVLDKQVASSGSSLIDSGLVESQVELLTSDNLLASVVRNQNLVDDPEFNTNESGLLSTLLSYLSAGGGAPPSEEQRVQKVVEAMQRSMKVDRLGTTYVLSVAYTARTPAKAARLANAIADAYIMGGLEAKYASTKRAGQWLQARSVELREEATRADRAVQTFRAQNNIIGTSRGLMSEQELADVNSQLVQARAATAEAKAKLDRIRAVTDKDVVQSTVSEALNNSVITRLRAQYLDLSAQYADWSSRFGLNHQASLNLQSRMAELRKSIQDEVRRISDATQSDYEISRAREQALQKELDNLVKQSATTSQVQVELRNLESAADTSRTLYNNFLERLKQATQQETFPITDARVITTASPPERKSSPKTLALMVAGVLGGLLIGTAAGFARELMSDVFRTPSDVEEHLGLRCLGILPAIGPASSHLTKSEAAIPPTPSGSRAMLSGYVVKNPFSRYAETLRNIKISIDAACANKPVRIVGIVSSLPKEGKTTVSANLAHLAAMTGHRTLVIDGDLHTCSLTRMLAPTAEAGLLEALSDPSQLSRYVKRLDASGADLLPAVLDKRLVNAADVLASQEMAVLLDVVRERYKYVFIDLAPVMAVTDAKATSHLLDGLIYVIEWGNTRRDAVMEAIGSSDIYDQIIGTVLNRGDQKVLRRIESYKGSYYNSYYTEKV